ncbi:hypothetical protein HELRODRAFT_190066 [Helobdella robusta]|uniref:BAH domain-containing protein n=1 Tax=Helobdella robusta TaxID=6412 RepID=T1FRN2_HELRO|nr:hypothetical protein HELRODRAFT_190066 [Helobdella robusta]ESO11865.1 hypothetical protein HELRODRAFT_190066 [Helobdella robusta]
MLVPHQLNDGFSNINTEVFKHDKNKSSILMNGCTESKNEHEDGNGDNETDVIRCVCNIYNDEGVMIQCEKCETWQHCMCMGVKGDEEEYMCELCQPRQISQEILLVPQPDHGLPLCRYYITLLRDDRLQVRVGDCVYVSQESSTDNTADEEKVLDKREFGIFRVERLWRKYNGDGCASGYYYVRPHETFHEPNRKFFPNEVFRTPRYHVIPIENVVGTCCVMDLNTYCKGRPLSVTNSEDLYICDYRVDETARLFYKISKTKHPINTNFYCFHHYTTKLKPKRTYMPHQINKP